MSDLTLQVILVAALVPSVILHEVSHGAVAYLFGDETAKQAGRLTLNPVPHIDPFGSVILPALLAFSSFGVFGYAKPVPVNPRNLRSPRNHSLLVSLAGPATNVALAAVAAVVARSLEPGTDPWVVAVLAGFVNLILAAFNMLPVPPLDGSAVVERVLPRHWWPAWLKLRRYAMGFLLIGLLLAGSLLQNIFEPLLEFWRDVVGDTSANL